MGLRFRRSIRLGKGLRLNVSKRGIGLSAGVKGARVSIGPAGTRTTVSLPGTGVSYTKQIGSRSRGGVLEQVKRVLADTVLESPVQREARDRVQAEDYEGAIPLLQQLLREDPDALPVRLALGVCFIQLQDYEAAITVLKQAPLRRQKPDPVLTEIRYHLGYAYLQVGQKSRARTQLKRVYSEDVTYRDVAALLEECKG